MWNLDQISFECYNAKSRPIVTSETWASTPALPLPTIVARTALLNI